MNLLALIQDPKPSQVDSAVKTILLGPDWQKECALESLNFVEKGSKDYTYIFDHVCKQPDMALSLGSIGDGAYYIGIIRYRGKVLLQTEAQSTVSMAASLALLMLAYLQKRCACRYGKASCSVPHEIHEASICNC